MLIERHWPNIHTNTKSSNSIAICSSGEISGHVKLAPYVNNRAGLPVDDRVSIYEVIAHYNAGSIIDCAKLSRNEIDAHAAHLESDT